MTTLKGWFLLENSCTLDEIDVPKSNDELPYRAFPRPVPRIKDHPGGRLLVGSLDSANVLRGKPDAFGQTAPVSAEW